MRKLQQPLELTIRQGGPSPRVAVGSGDDPSVRIVQQDDGRIRAHCPARGGFDNPPSFDGVVRRTSLGLEVSGVITESTLSTLWLRGCRIVSIAAAILTVVCVVLLAVHRDSSGVGPLLICLGGALVFGWLYRGFRKSRAPEFAAQAQTLRDQLEWSLRGTLGAQTKP